MQTRSDDGIKVSINTNGVTTVLIDNWTDHAPVDNTGSITLCQGTHWFEVRHYENTGSATAKATWFF